MKEEFRLGITKGYSKLELSGGEVTIRGDIVELLNYAKEIGYSDILLQTNGRMFFYRHFVKDMLECEVNGLFISIHASNSKMGDFQTRTKGSFDQTVQGIKNLKDFGFSGITTNTVINKHNYQHLPEIVKFLCSLGVEKIHLSFVHPAGWAYSNFEDIVPTMTEVLPYLHRAIDEVEKNGINCNVEALPFCLMKGYEKNILEPKLLSTEV